MKSKEVNIGKAVLVCCNVVFLVRSVIAGYLSKLSILVFINCRFKAIQKCSKIPLIWEA